MDKENHLKDLQEIRSIMERSTRFISLSGLSGVVAGIIALIGAGIAYSLLIDFQGYAFWSIDDYNALLFNLTLLGSIVLVSAIGAAFVFTYLKARKDNAQIWNAASRKLAINLAIPLLTGGIMVLFLLHYQLFVFIAPFTMIFYGLSCVNASHHTVSDIRYLGLTLLLVGIFNMFYLGYGLYFWAFGFGILHILYGSIMYFKYERKQ